MIVWKVATISLLGILSCDAFTARTTRFGAGIQQQRMSIVKPSFNRRRMSLSMDVNEDNNETPNSSSSSSSSSILDLKQQAARVKLEAERLEAELTLEKIAKLEQRIKIGGENLNKNDILKQIQTLAQTVDPSVLENSIFASTSNSNNNEEVETNRYKNWKAEGTLFDLQQQQQQLLSEAELEAASSYFVTLPKPLRMALAKACEFENDTSVNPSIIVLALYERKNELTPQKLQQLYRQELYGNPSLSTVDEEDEELEGDAIDMFAKIVLEKDPEQYRLENMVESLLPRVTRDGRDVPTEQDAQLFASTVLGKDTFSPSSNPIPIPGGYIIRGENKVANTTLLLDTIDSMMESAHKEWSEKFQVCYIMDPTPESTTDVEKIDGDPVLFLTTRDFTPAVNRFLLYPFTLVSLFFTIVFCISTFGANDVVMSQLTEMAQMAESGNGAAVGDLGWFNNLLIPVIAGLAIPQVAHEMAHLFVAWKYKFKITPPTILPLLTLPYLTFQNKIKTSPKNLQALFELGFAGPAAGMACSLVLFLTGLQLTLSMDAEALKYAPALPVGFLNLSTLGGTLVDTFVGGGDGILLGQDPGTAVKLHPFAIAGLASLMIQSLDAIPVGSNDGGRISQSLLGRSGHLVFSGLIYFSLLIYVVFNPDHRELFLAFLLFNGFAQKDMEVPCRDEVTELSVPQAAASLVLWSIAILTLVPLS